jgi:hypothetical protein
MQANLLKQFVETVERHRPRGRHRRPSVLRACHNRPYRGAAAARQTIIKQMKVVYSST